MFLTCTPYCDYNSHTMIKLAEYIKQVRLNLKLTQRQFGEKIETKRHNIAKYETGRSVPPGDVLLKIQGLEQSLTLDPGQND